MCGFKVNSVTLLPFGGITIIDEKINHSINKELLVAIMGPIFQIIFVKIVNNEMFYSLHLPLLLFNLLPIYPLDGSKIINIIFNKILPFKSSYKVSIGLSYILIFIILTLGIHYHLNLLFILIVMLLLKRVVEEHMYLKETFNKFLLERYLYDFNYRKIKRIKNINNMYLERRHLIKYNKWYTEKEILKKMFDK